MNKRWKQKWVAALTSKKFKQGEGELLRDGHYCCLGVLRTIMHKGSRKMWNNEDSVEDLLCKEHQDEAGLTYKQQERLADLNDSGKTFPEIAKWITRHL